MVARHGKDSALPAAPSQYLAQGGDEVAIEGVVFGVYTAVRDVAGEEYQIRNATALDPPLHLLDDLAE